MHTPTRHPRRRARAGSALLASVATLTLTLLPFTGAHAADRIVFDQGHVDAFNVEAKDGGLALDLKEDITGNHVHHSPEDVELHVKSAALSDIPQGVPGAPQAYYLPLTQNHELLWPGWDTLGTQADGVDPKVEIHFDNVQGPGDIHMFSFGSFGGLQPVLADGDTKLNAGDVRKQDYPAHTHADWIFTKPGVYTITAHAEGTVNGKAVESNDATYTFTVGDDFRGATNTPAPAPKPAPEQSAPKAPVADKPGTDASQPAPKASAKKAPAKKAPAKKAPAKKAPAKKAPAQNKPAKKTPAPAKKAPPQAAAPKAEAPKAPATDTAVEASSESAPVARPVPVTAPKCEAVEEVRAATKQEIAGTQATTGTAKVQGSYTVPANTHTHPNWVFSKPGTYKVTVRQSVKTKSGQTLSDDATLTFNVGPNASGVTSGHFDFGPRIENGKLIASLKDDRKSPAPWVEPSTITFALNNASKAKAPAGIEFVAPAGADVYMVPGSQIAGVPWLGANSMHPSIVQQTTGEVTMTLVSVSGPGNLGVFTSGNFGQVVGAKWFWSTAGGTTAATYAKDRESAKPGQVFKDGNSFKVVDIKGKTADGAECQLNVDQLKAAGVEGSMLEAYGVQASGASDAGGEGGPLARTGVEAAGVTGLGVALTAAGAAAVALRRRTHGA